MDEESNVNPDGQPKDQAPAEPKPEPKPVDPVLAALHAAQARLAELETAQARERQAKELAEREKLVEKGEAKRLAELLDQERKARESDVAERDTRLRRVLLDREIASALVGKSLVPNAESDLLNLWREEFEVAEAADGQYVARSKTDLRPVAAVIAERLGSPRWAHFVQASHRGGTSGGGSPSPTPGQKQEPTGTLAQQLANRLTSKYQPK